MWLAIYVGNAFEIFTCLGHTFSALWTNGSASLSTDPKWNNFGISTISYTNLG